MSEKLFEFTDDNFKTEVLESETPVLVDFWAEWCGPCQMMTPILEELTEIFPKDKIKIGKLNVDENPQSAKDYDIRSIPAFIFFKDGQIIDDFVGAYSKSEMQNKIESILKK